MDFPPGPIPDLYIGIVLLKCISASACERPIWSRASECEFLTVAMSDGTNHHTKTRVSIGGDHAYEYFVTT